MGQCLCKEKLKSRKVAKNVANVSKTENGSGPSTGVQDGGARDNEGILGRLIRGIIALTSAKIARKSC